MKNKSSLAAAIFTIAAVIIAIKFNPLDRFMEAGNSAYYQARVAFEYGSKRERVQLTTLADAGQITVYDYEMIVFPAYLKIIDAETSLFPDSEKNKTKPQIRNDFIHAVQMHRDGMLRLCMEGMKNWPKMSSVVQNEVATTCDEFMIQKERKMQ